MAQVQRIAIMGDEAVALAVKQAKVDLVAAYPITPQTIIVERLSEYVADGELDAAFIQAESEHSALSICVGAALAGARVFTSTCSQGLALMHEIVYAASSMRIPMVMTIVNRSLNAPLNIHCEHGDVMPERDSGWVHLFAANVQEAYDLTFIAFKLSEREDVMLPVSVNLDAFILSHSIESLIPISDEDAARFLPPREYKLALDFDNPITHGTMALPDTYMEFKMQLKEAVERAKSVYPEIVEEYARISGRKYWYFNSYMADDADAVVMVLGSTYGTLKTAARELREKGLKVGVIGLTMFRPFPEEQLVDALKGVRAVVVMDRAYGYGGLGGQLYTDVVGALYRNGIRIPAKNVVFGLGGRDFKLDEAEAILKMAAKGARDGGFDTHVQWWGVRA
ncbi:MAG: pyruvate ferredoxin oxidoreductase [Aigarchaeota archaeon]|nr:pyruvate ferredoxin oxidoreductase [Aigarchaeota archaeon]MDW8021498.1 transketolase C-terminal domain-containing protein [Nitrososphaerota archaeon]